MTSKREGLFKSHLTKEYLITNRLERHLSLRKIQVAQFIESKRFRSNDKAIEMDVETTSEFNGKGISSSSSFKLWKELQNLNYDKKESGHYTKCLKSDDPRTKLQALVGIRKLLSMRVEPPIKEIMTNETLVELFKIAKSSYDDRILFEIIWIFVNIASLDSYTQMLNENGIMDIISDMISRSNPYDLLDELVWLIANIAGDDSDYSHEMRRRNFHEFLFGVFIRNISSLLNRSCLWALCNVLKGAKEINLSENLCLSVSICCEIIGCYINNKNNSNFKTERIEFFISNAISVICLLTECKPCTLSILLKHASADHFMKLLNSVKKDEGTYLSVLRVLGNFSANEHIYTDEIIKYNIFLAFKEILENNPSSNIIKEICWILSNIAAGLEEHVNLFFTTKDFLCLLFKISAKENSDVTKEVVWCICNLTTTSNSIYINCLVNYGIIEIFGKWICHTDYRLPALVMEALDNVMISLMNHDISRKLLYAQCDNFGIIQKLQALSHNRNDFLSNKSEQLMNKYFLCFREEEDLEVFNKEELIMCPGNDITDESDDIMPFITGVKNKENRNKENDPDYGNSNSLNDSHFVDYSEFI